MFFKRPPIPPLDEIVEGLNENYGGGTPADLYEKLALAWARKGLPGNHGMVLINNPRWLDRDATDRYDDMNTLITVNGDHIVWTLDDTAAVPTWVWRTPALD